MRYPCCSATLAATIFAEAPINVPFPEKNIFHYKKWRQFKAKKSNYSPPKQAPNDNAQTSGCKGRCNTSANDRTILIIIVVKGILSTKADAIADTQTTIRMATVKRDSSWTDLITFSVWVPIHSMSPSLANDSINMNKPAKNSSVAHSTRAKIDSISLRSAKINNKIAPRSAIHPSDSLSMYGSEWQKKHMRTNINATADLIRRT